MKLKFSKMHGLGNDFVVLDGVRQQVALTPEQLRYLADRHFGVGCDQILLVEKPSQPGVDFGRIRFNEVLLLSRQDGMRKIVKALKDGYPFYYLPDMDFGPKESIFVPFFGVQTATIPALSRLVRLTGARVVPVITRQVPDGYEVELMAPWADFPGESVEADTAFMNRFIESQVLQMPEQYFWLHKRFKTRPPGEQRFYK